MSVATLSRPRPARAAKPLPAALRSLPRAWLEERAQDADADLFLGSYARLLRRCPPTPPAALEPEATVHTEAPTEISSARPRLSSLPLFEHAAASVITASMFDVQRVLIRVANVGGEMPNNPVLGELAGGRGRSSALRALRRLVRARVLVLEISGSRRRVMVVATGRWTDWGEARPGHAPFLHRSRTDPKPEAPAARPRAPESRALPTVSIEPGGVEAHRISLASIRHAPTCQYLMEDENAPRRRFSMPRYCEEAVLRGSSFCPEHATLCFTPSRRRASFSAGCL